MQYLKNQFKILEKSFKDFNIQVIFITLFDLLFYSLALLSLFLFSKFVQNKTVEISKIPIDQLMTLPQDQLTVILGDLRNFLFILILGIVILVIALFLITSIFKSLIWLKIADKKLTKNYLKKFMLTKLIWSLIWFVPILIIFFLLKKELIAPVLIIVTLLLFHFTNIFYVSFIKENKLSSIKSTFKTGLKIHLLILPYILIIIGFLIVMQLYWFYKFTPENVQGVISAMILIAYIAFSRIYLYNNIKAIE
jgi:hypothetical protein